MVSRMRNKQGTRGMFTTIPRSLLKDLREHFNFNVSVIVLGKCSRRFRGTFQKIPVNIRKGSGNIWKDSGECLRRFRGMFKEISVNSEKIPGNVNKDSRECY